MSVGNWIPCPASLCAPSTQIRGQGALRLITDLVHILMERNYFVSLRISYSRCNQKPLFVSGVYRGHLQTRGIPMYDSNNGHI
jgi:hypothetical protein